MICISHLPCGMIKSNFNPCFVVNYLHLSPTFCSVVRICGVPNRDVVRSCRLITHSVEEKSAVIEALSTPWWRASHCAGSELSLRRSSNTPPQTYALQHTEISLHLLSKQRLVCSFCQSFHQAPQLCLTSARRIRFELTSCKTVCSSNA